MRTVPLPLTAARDASQARELPVPRMFDFPELRPGTMVVVPPGTTYKRPGLPGVPTSGAVWITSISPNRLEMHEETRIGGIPTTFTSVLERSGPWRATYTMRGSAWGIPLPTIEHAYQILDAGRGYLELRSESRPNEPVSSLRLDGTTLVSDMAGPWGIRSPRRERLVQPGAPEYRLPTHASRSWSYHSTTAR